MHKYEEEPEDDRSFEEIMADGVILFAKMIVVTAVITTPFFYILCWAEKNNYKHEATAVLIMILVGLMALFVYKVKVIDKKDKGDK